MKRIIHLSLIALFFISTFSMLGQLPKYGVGPGGVGNAQGTDGQPHNTVWLKLDGRIVFYDEDTKEIDTVVDQSGNTFNAVRFIGRPTNYEGYFDRTCKYVENELNGKPAMDCGWGEKTGMIIPDYSPTYYLDGTPGIAMFVVCKRHSIPADDVVNPFHYILNKRCENCGDPNDYDRPFVLQFDGGPATGTNRHTVQFNPNGQGNYFYTQTKVTNTNYNIISANFNRNYQMYQVYLYLNGKKESVGSFSQDIYHFTGGVPIGIAPNNAQSIAEIILYKTGLFDPQVKIIHNYLAGKYGINIAKDNLGNNILFSNNKGYTEDIIGVGTGYNDYKIHNASAGGGIILEHIINEWLDSTLRDQFVFAAHKDVALNENSNRAWSRSYYIRSVILPEAPSYYRNDINLYFDYRGKTNLTYPSVNNEYYLYKSLDATMFTFFDSNSTLVDSTVMFAIPDVQTAYYKIAKAGTGVEDPVISPSSNPKYSDTVATKVVITCATTAADIYYTTDGSDPVLGSGTTIKYTDTITIPLGYTYFKARAVIDLNGGWLASNIVKAEYDLVPEGTVGSPIFSPVPGSYETVQKVSITTATSGATIYYTTNGSTPDSLSTVYTGPITIAMDECKVIKAIAYKDGMKKSYVTTGSFCVSGIAEVAEKNKASLIIYPVPANNNITVDYIGTTNGNIVIKIYDMTGKIQSIIEADKTRMIKENIDISNLSNGIYLLEVVQDNNRMIKRFIKK